MDTEQFVAQLDDRLRHELHPAILAHSHRVLAIASAETEYFGWHLSPYDLAIASMFHDSGTASDTSPDRFEVVGADKAVAFARQVLRRPEDSCERIWLAVALHTSPGIAERADPLVRAVRAGVTGDFGNAVIRDRHPDLISQLELRRPRDGIESVLARTVVAAALEEPAKAPRSSWPYDLVEGHRLSGGNPINPNF